VNIAIAMFTEQECTGPWAYIPSCWGHYDINLLEDLHMMVHNPSPEANHKVVKSKHK
jgi:hypothetical protein